MRSFSHWTPKYVFDRLSVALYERRFPDYPWLTKDANAFLESWFLPTDIGLEFGSGRSTPWIAQRVGKLYSVETNSQWSERVSQSIVGSGIANVICRFLPGDGKHGLDLEQ